MPPASEICAIRLQPYPQAVSHKLPTADTAYLASVALLRAQQHMHGHC